MNVLIADDDRILAAALSASLRKAGFDVHVAFDAMQAIMMATRMQLSLIVLDIGMPGGTGCEVLRRLKANMRTSLTPVLVLTGSLDPTMRQEVMELGAAGFLAKPQEWSRITAEVLRLLPATAGDAQPWARAGAMQ